MDVTKLLPIYRRSVGLIFCRSDYKIAIENSICLKSIIAAAVLPTHRPQTPYNMCQIISFKLNTDN